MLLATGIGLVELHPATCDSISDVRLRIVVGVLELVDVVLRVVNVARIWYSFVIGGVGSTTACVRAKVGVIVWIMTCWLGTRLSVAMLLSITSR